MQCRQCGQAFDLNGPDVVQDKIPKSIDKFEVLCRVGMGSFGTVWKAVDRPLERIVAIKVPRNREMSRDERRRFLDEAKSAARLSHQNIAKVYEVGTDDGMPYIVSEFIEGPTLADAVVARTFTSKQVARLCRDLALGLSHAHKNGVIHRDLKPANIILNNEDIPLITDFGLAKRVQHESQVTTEGMIVGTLAYMSPEQASGSSNIDGRSDVYSLGVTMYFLCTNELPKNYCDWNHQTSVAQAKIRRLRENVHRDLETICLKCLEVDPNQRFASAEALAQDLERFLADAPIASKPIGVVGRTKRYAIRNPSHLLIATLAIISTFLMLSSRGPNNRNMSPLSVAATENQLEEKLKSNNKIYRKTGQRPNRNSNQAQRLNQVRVARDFTWHYAQNKGSLVRRRLIGFPNEIKEIAIGENNTFSATNGNLVQVYDLQGRLLAVRSTQQGPSDLKVDDDDVLLSESTDILHSPENQESWPPLTFDGVIRSVHRSGDRIAVVSDRVQILDANSGAHLNTIPRQLGVPSAAAITPGGNHVIVGSDQGTLDLFDLQPAYHFYSLPMTTPIVSARIFANHGAIAIVSETRLSLRSLDDGALLERIDHGGIDAVDLISKTIAVVQCTDGSTELWNLKRKTKNRIDITGSIRGIEARQQYGAIVIATASELAYCRFSSESKLDVVHRLPVKNEIVAATFCRRSQRLLTLDDLGMVSVFDISRIQEGLSKLDHFMPVAKSDRPFKLILSKTGNRLAVLGLERTTLWNSIGSLAFEKTGTISESLTLATFSGDQHARTLVSDSNNGLMLRDGELGESRFEHFETTSKVLDIGFQNDRYLYAVDANGHVHRWQGRNPARAQTVISQPSRLKRVLATTKSASNDLILAASGSKLKTVYRLPISSRLGQTKTLLDLDSDTVVTSVALSPLNLYLFGLENGVVEIWNGGELAHKFRDFRNRVDLVAWHPGGTSFASTSMAEPIVIHNLKAERTVSTSALQSLCCALGFASDRLFAGLLDGRLLSIDLETGAFEVVLELHQTIPFWSFSQAGAALCDTVGNLRLLNLKSGELSDPLATGFDVTTLRLSVDGGRLCVGTNDGSVVEFRVEDYQSQTQVRRLKLHDKAIESIRFVDGTSKIATAATGGPITVTDLEKPR